MGLRSSPPTHRRSFERDCSGCHVSGTSLREKVGDKRVEGGWRAAAIDCEACHGPALDHVEAWRRLDDSEPLLDLSRLSARSSTAVCARCHGGSPVSSKFTPADAEHWVARPRTGLGVFSHGAASGQIYQADALLRSACHLEGGLACTDCHGWHSDQAQHPEHVDAVCSRCHTAQTGRDHTHHAMKGEGGRCVNCHMPRLLTGLMAHQRDHRISSPLPAAEEAPDACTACHRDRDKAWAARWAEDWWGAPPELTLTAVRGVHLARSGEASEARPLLERVRSHPQPFFRWASAAWLGQPEWIADEDLVEGRFLALELASGQRGDTAMLRRALGDPSPVLRSIAYATLARRGRTQGGAPVADLEVATRISSLRPGVRVALARAYLAEQRVAEAVGHCSRKRWSSPTDRGMLGWSSRARTCSMARRTRLPLRCGVGAGSPSRCRTSVPSWRGSRGTEESALERALLSAAAAQVQDAELGAWARERLATLTHAPHPVRAEGR